MNERCKNCVHSPASHDNWGTGACAAPSCHCQAYVEPDLYAPVTADRYTYLGLPAPTAVVARFVDGLTVFDGLYGTHVVRRRTAEYVGVPRKPKGAAA